MKPKEIMNILVPMTVLWLLTGCGGPKVVQGEYDVNGSAGAVANINYAPNGVGSNVTVNNQTLPWSVQFTGYESEGSYTGTYVFLSALIVPPSTASTAVTITIREAGANYQQNYQNGVNNAVTILGNF